MTILPGETPCFRCLVPVPPATETTPTCDTAGVLGPIVSTIASLQTMEILKLASHHRDQCNRGLMVVDLWDNQLRQIDLSKLGEAGSCPTCKQGNFEWLDGRKGSQSEVLCGRNAVQLSSVRDEPINFDDLADKLAPIGRVVRNAYLLKLYVDDHVLTVFADGRTVVSGTDDPAEARTLYARYVGH